MRGFALKEHPINPFDELGLLRVDHQVSILTHVITQETFERDGHFAVSESFSLTPNHVLRNTSTFLLSQARHNRDEEFALGVKCPDIFFLEINLDPFFLELANRG